MSEYKIQKLVCGEWLDASEIDSDYEYIKQTIKLFRAGNPDIKYRLIGRECHPWCELKEDEVKYGS